VIKGDWVFDFGELQKIPHPPMIASGKAESPAEK
jgi:hypothetical protein